MYDECNSECSDECYQSDECNSSVIPIIKKSTRVTNYTATSIDNIITISILHNDFNIFIMKTDLSDHFPIIFIIELKNNYSSKNKLGQPIYQRDFNENSLNLFKQNLFEASWNSVKSELTQMSRVTNFSKFLPLYISTFFHEKKLD